MLQVLLALTLVTQSAWSAERVKLAPALATEFDLGTLKGKLVRELAWSPDGAELYLMTYDPTKDALVKEAFHYLMPSRGGAPKRVDVKPEWAQAYFDWKAAQAAPGDASLKIEVATEKRKEGAVAVPFGGDLARGGTNAGTGGISASEAMAAADGMKTYDAYAMRLKGETVGEWINHPIVPGLTFGWGPKGSGLIAFAELKSGRLILMDRTGAKQKFDDTRNVVLPAWNEDGTRLAYLESRGRNRFALFVATVTR